eukprot:3566195-Pyramimonas_sp.AAC.1
MALRSGESEMHATSSEVTPVQYLPGRDPGALQPGCLQRQHLGAGHVQQSGREHGQALGSE